MMEMDFDRVVFTVQP